MRLATCHPTWALGFEDEVWWSRLARPALHSWAVAAGGADGRADRRGPEGPGLLWTVGALGPADRRVARKHLAALYQRAAGERPDDRLSGLVLRPAGGGGQGGVAAGVGQRALACQQGGPA